MNEVISFDVPLQIKELGGLNSIVDELKTMSNIYNNHCRKTYISPAEGQSVNVTSIVKPKKRKRAGDLTPITFK